MIIFSNVTLAIFFSVGLSESQSASWYEQHEREELEKPMNDFFKKRQKKSEEGTMLNRLVGGLIDQNICHCLATSARTNELGLYVLS